MKRSATTLLPGLILLGILPANTLATQDNILLDLNNQGRRAKEVVAVIPEADEVTVRFADGATGTFSRQEVRDRTTLAIPPYKTIKPRLQPVACKMPPGAGTLASTQKANANDALALTSRIRGEEVVQAAEAILRKNSENAAADQALLTQAYSRLSRAEVARNLGRAQAQLQKLARDLERSVQSDLLAPAERARFRNVFRNAADKAELLAAKLKSGGLTDPTVQAFLQGLAADPTSVEGLVDRTILLHGLSDADRSKLLPQLKLLEKPELSLAGRKRQRLLLLHNGYIFGGSATGTDCSAFVSASLPPELRKGRMTTLDFLAIAIYLRTGKFPKPPIYPEERIEMLRSLATSLGYVDLKGGVPLLPGDLLVYRTLKEDKGHVFLVKRYLPERLLAQVLEASQTAGTLRERDFFLSTYPEGAPRRPLRGGLFGLRIQSAEANSCSLEKTKK